MSSITIDVALGIVDKVRNWIAPLVSEIIQQQALRDAQILQACVTLVVLLRGLDNEFRALLSDLSVFELDWEKERRKELVKKISDIAHRRIVISEIRQSLKSIQRRLAELRDEDRVLVEEIWNYGTALLRALGTAPVTPFPDEDVLQQFFERIRDANTKEDVETIRSEGRKILGVLNYTILDAADDSLGTLMDQISDRHPELPKPDWNYPPANSK